MAVVSTGFFDGIHLGHREVISTLVSSSRERGEESIVVTFANHPRAVLQQDARVLRLLTSRKEKILRLRDLGVDKVEVIDFTREFAAMTARQYIERVLVREFGATALVLGYDNRIGSDMMGAEECSKVCEELGLSCKVVPARSVEIDGAEVTLSSTKIREVLGMGNVELASSMLGYDYRLEGVVVAGKQLGRTIGFPTANMQLRDPLKILPAKGVYFTKVKVMGRSYWGMTNVADIVETHIFDFDEDIYGLDIKVEFKKRLREMRRFENLEQLGAQLAIDREACRGLY